MARPRVRIISTPCFCSMHYDPSCHICHRRRFIRQATLGTAALFTVPGAFAEKLALTPRQTEGPFYPDKLPLDTDNDLLILNDAATPSLGEITYLGGRVLSENGSPIKGATVEIWQVDNEGSYLHTRGMGPSKKRDKNFQGFGRCLTGSKGEYFFRTIKPVPYPGRTPHIHVMVKKGGKKLLTTQCYIKGHELNQKDRVMGDKEKAKLLMVDWKPIKDSKVGAYSAKFDMVLGLTPED